MQKMKKTITKISIALTVLLMAASCTAPGATEPTPDLNAIKTEAVKTAMAEMTVQSALSPTETSVPATMTPLPTATLGDGAAQPAAGSSGGYSSSSSGSSASTTDGTAIPTWTPDVYQCEYVTEYPLDEPQVTGSNYDKTWTFRNVSTAVWDTENYYLKWMGGDDLSPYHTYKLPHDVGYWETVKLTIDVQVPTKPFLKDNGLVAYVDNWAIVNDNGEAFCKMTNVITLTYTPVPTWTDTPEP